MALPKFVAGSNFKLKIMQNFSSKCVHLYGPSTSNIYTNSTPVSQYFMPIYPLAMCGLCLNDSLWNVVPGSALKKIQFWLDSSENQIWFWSGSQ
jgi:hypothetical protein